MKSDEVKGYWYIWLFCYGVVWDSFCGEVYYLNVDE